MGNRLSRSSVLSDPKVIDLLEREFVATELNVTDQGFPDSLPALAWWKKLYQQNGQVQLGFGNQVVVDASGRYPLASGDDGQVDRWTTSIDYNSDLYTAMLRQALDRWHRLQSIQSDAKLSSQQKDQKVRDLQQEVGRSVSKAYRRPAW
jgi:hypothetical protein